MYELRLSAGPWPRVTGDSQFEKAEDGKWYTGQLTVDGAGSYQLYLPDGMTVDGSADNTVAGNTAFRLVSETRPAAGEVSIADLAAQYVPDDIRFYTPLKNGQQSLNRHCRKLSIK